MLKRFAKKERCIIIRMDENGKVIETLQDATGKFPELSEVAEHDGYLYLGSSSAKYIGRLKLN